LNFKKKKKSLTSCDFLFIADLAPPLSTLSSEPFFAPPSDSSLGWHAVTPHRGLASFLSFSFCASSSPFSLVQFYEDIHCRSIPSLVSCVWRPFGWRLRSSSAYPGSFGIRVTSGDLISAVIWLAPNSILRVRRTFTHRTRLLQRGRATEGNRLRLFDADRGRREAEICVPSRHPQGGSVHVALRAYFRASNSR
jgi:hypothetical protein